MTENFVPPSDSGLFLHGVSQIETAHEALARYTAVGTKALEVTSAFLALAIQAPEANSSMSLYVGDVDMKQDTLFALEARVLDADDLSEEEYIRVTELLNILRGE